MDHFGECTGGMRAYLACLKKHGQDAAACRDLSRTYLECRMDRELMARQPLEELGFGGAGGRGGRRGDGGVRGGREANDKRRPDERETETAERGPILGGMKYTQAGKKAAEEARQKQR